MTDLRIGKSECGMIRLRIADCRLEGQGTVQIKMK